MSPAEATSTTAESRLLDLASLLLPLSADNPAGKDLRHSGLFDKLDNYRNPKAEKDVQKNPDWSAIYKLTNEELLTKSKDLRLCMRLAEAMSYLHGLAGLRDSLTLLTKFHRSEELWASMFPRNPKEEVIEKDEAGNEILKEIDDPTPRANLLKQMAENVSIAIGGIQITGGLGVEPWIFHKWESLRHQLANYDRLYKNRDKPEEGLDEIARANVKTSENQWINAKDATPIEFCQQLLAAVTQCGQEFQALEQVVIDRYGNKSPNLKPLATLLEQLQELSEEIIQEKVPEGTVSPATPADIKAAKPQPVSSVPPPALVPIPAEPIFSREEAVQQLRAIATFFRATERHNPLPWLIELGIVWGDMPLDQWLKELKSSGITLEQLIERLHLAEDSSAS